MKKSLKILIIISAVVTAIAVAVLVMMYLSSDAYLEEQAMKNEKLVKYSYSRGGDMIGSRRSEEIKLLGDGTALFSVSSADWYAQDDTVSEYIIDAAVLDELAEVFRDNHMNRWENKKITDIFVADGASESYSFRFGDTSIGFSSQYYPEKYAKPLKKMDDIIRKYSEGKEKLPGLVMPENTEDEEELYKRSKPEAGVFKVIVYKYSGGHIYFRLLNGLENEIKYPNTFSLFNTDTGEEIALNNTKYPGEHSVYADYLSEEDVETAERLEPGRYRLEVGEYSAEFEIR